MERFLVVFSSASAAIDLWAFGEDELADDMTLVDDDCLRDIWRTAAEYYDTDFPLPVTGRKITLGHVAAFACMFHLEGRLRPLSRLRRRPSSAIPERYLDLEGSKSYQTSHNFVHNLDK